MIATVEKEQKSNKTELPDGWQWLRLENVCDRIDYGFTASANFAINEPRFLRITDIQSGRVDWDKVPGCKISTIEEASNSLLEGDIVFARTGGTTGKSFLIKQLPVRAVFASYLIRLRLKQDVFPDYIYAFLQSNSYWSQIRASARGGAQPNVNATLLGKIAFPLPPLPEQKRIVGIMNEQMTAVQTARAATEEQLRAAKALPAAYLREVFESEEAQTWERRRLGDIAVTCSGTTPARERKEYYVGTIPWVKTGELQDGCIQDTEEHVSDKALSETSLRLLPAQTLLIAMYGQGKTRGRTGLLSVPATTNQACFAILPNPEVFDVQYLQWWFRHSYTRLRAETEGRGGNQPNLNGEVLRSQLVPLPPLSLQQVKAETLKAPMETVDQACQSLQEQLSAINNLPATLLQRAFNGEL